MSLSSTMSATSTSTSSTSNSMSSPYPSTPHSALSSSPLETPPESLRHYATALKAKMRLGMESAMKDLKTDRGPLPHKRRPSAVPVRQEGFEVADEDPIDRHVRMYLTPRKLPDGRPRVSEGEQYEDADEPMLGSSPTFTMDANGRINRPPSFRPGLIHFERSTSSASSSSRASYPGCYYSSSNHDLATPGSTISEQSFEAIKAEDYVSMYGGTDGEAGAASQEEHGGGKMTRNDSGGEPLPLPPPPRGGGYAPPAESPFGIISSYAQPSPIPQSMRQHESRLSALSTLSSSTVTSQSTLKPLRPGMGRRKRSHPYAASAEMARGGAGAGAGAGGSASTSSLGGGIEQGMTRLGVGLAGGGGGEEAWLSGRTISETMVAQAGLRCQRGRGVRAGR